jgi:hypothetical protein
MLPIGDAPPSSSSAPSPPLWLRFWADLLDSRFRIPGTDIRFGIDPILTVVLLVQGLRQHVPRVVMVRMVVNALIDALIGAIPVAGNIGDIFWRANNLNLALLERHAQAGRPPTAGDYAFVWLIALVLGLLILVPVLIALWLATVLWHLVAGR